ncbi:MAG: DUF3311 domain-containing protein [Rhizomicrobium sp.]|nr:DUF3311 domain-containing protein [Rhizomicrobium sp.]
MGGKLREGFRWHYLVLLAPLLLLWVPSYNRSEPSLFGLPFFYWYQMTWVVVTALLTAIVFFIDKALARGAKR